MAASKELEKIEELIDLIREIKQTTATNFSKLEMRLELMSAQQEDTRKKIQEINNIIHDQDEGLFKRIADVNYNIKTISTNLSSSQLALDDLEETVDKIDNISTNLILIAGERLENLDSTIKTNKNSKKILWAFIIGVVSLAGEQLLKLF